MLSREIWLVLLESIAIATFLRWPDRGRDRRPADSAVEASKLGLRRQPCTASRTERTGDLEPGSRPAPAPSASHFDRGRSFGSPLQATTGTTSNDPRETLVRHTGLTPEELNDGFVVAIDIAAKDGEAEAVAGILEGLVAPTMAEPGVKLFLPYRSPGDPARFFVFELYRNEDAWGAHQETAHFKAAVERLLPRVSKRERVPFVPYTSPCS